MKKLHVLCVATPAWDGDYIKSSVQLMSALAKTHRVLYVEYGFTYADLFQGFLGKKNIPSQRVLGLQPRLRRIDLKEGGEVFVLTLPPLLPINFLENKTLHARLAKWNAQGAAICIQNALNSLKMKDLDWHINAFSPILGCFLVGKFNAKMTAYYCYDEMEATPYLSKHGPRYEASFMKKCDLLLFSAAALKRKKAGQHPLAVVVQNAVDGQQFFQEIVAKPNRQKSKIVGYLGSVDNRLDVTLVEQSIRLYPKAIFRFIGRVNSSEMRALSKYPNVEFLGPKPSSDLPALVAEFDVCTIPFLQNDLTAGIYPMKINEYFALGKAVVTTSFGDMDDFKALAYVEPTKAGYLNALQIALDENAQDLRANRVEFSKANTWDARASQLSTVLQQGLSTIKEPTVL